MVLYSNIQYLFLKKKVNVEVFKYKNFYLFTFYDHINNIIITDKIIFFTKEKILNSVNNYFQKIKIDLKEKYKNKNSIPEWALNEYFKIGNTYILENNNKSVDVKSEDVSPWAKEEFLISKNIKI